MKDRLTKGRERPFAKEAVSLARDHPPGLPSSEFTVRPSCGYSWSLSSSGLSRGSPELVGFTVASALPVPGVRGGRRRWRSTPAPLFTGPDAWRWRAAHGAVTYEARSLWPNQHASSIRITVLFIGLAINKLSF